MPSPIGRIEVTASAHGVTSLAIEASGALPHDGHPEYSSRILDRAVQQLGEYFAGRRKSFTVPLDIAGTSFQRAIWDRLRQLHPGETISYGTLGVAGGAPGAGRAAATAVRSNPVPILIPCHRVLTARGTIAGYSRGAGVPTKLWLLAHEGALLAA